MEKTLSEYISLSKNLDDLKLEKKLKVAIMPSFTLNGLDETLRVKCSELNIKCQSYVSGYNQYNQEFLNPESNLYTFSPDITFLLLDIRNFLGEMDKFFIKTKPVEDVVMQEHVEKVLSEKEIKENWESETQQEIINPFLGLKEGTISAEMKKLFQL